MAYKTIFSALTAYSENDPALAMAESCASNLNAHLEVMCLGVDRVQATYYEMGANALVMQAAIEDAHTRADAIQTAVKARLNRTSLRWDILNGVGGIDSVGRTVAAQARFADLAILGLPYSDAARPEDCLILEGLLFEANCPTIVVPPKGGVASPQQIVIGWNESDEALRAVRAALPFLRNAKEVHLAVIDPPSHGPERSDPGGALAVFLSRHGVHSDIQVMSRGGVRISDRLTQHVRETGAEMLVMGGYGHSRFREALLGGATRDMLEHCDVPVLMAH